MTVRAPRVVQNCDVSREPLGIKVEQLGEDLLKPTASAEFSRGGEGFLIIRQCAGLQDLQKTITLAHDARLQAHGRCAGIISEKHIFFSAGRGSGLLNPYFVQPL